MIKANLIDVVDAIRSDAEAITGGSMGPSGATWQDIAGTLAVNLRVLADALDAQRNSTQTRWVSDADPITAIGMGIDSLHD